MGVRQLYEQTLAERGYAADPAQLRAVAALERCEHEWADYKARRSNAITKLRNGAANRLIKPGQVFNRIHVDDIAGVLIASLMQPRNGAIYNVTDDEPGPPQDVITFAAELTGLTPPPEIPFEQARLSPMAASFYGESKRVSNALVKQELGYAFRYPTYREALRTLAAAGE